MDQIELFSHSFKIISYFKLYNFVQPQFSIE